MLETVYQMMKQSSYILSSNDCVLCYDGIMIHSKNISTSIDSVIRQCESDVEDTHGIALKFAEKKMTKSR